MSAYTYNEKGLCAGRDLFLNPALTPPGLHQADNLRRLEQFRAEKHVGRELVGTRVEVHEPAVADGEPVGLVRRGPGLGISALGAREQIARRDANRAVADYRAVHAVRQVRSADESLEAVQAFDDAETDSFRSAVHVEVQAAENAGELRRLERHDAAVDRNVVVFRDGVQAGDRLFRGRRVGAERHVGRVDEPEHVIVDAARQHVSERVRSVRSPADAGLGLFDIRYGNRLDEVLVERNELAADFVGAGAVVVRGSVESSRGGKVIHRNRDGLAGNALELAEVLREQVQLSEVFVSRHYRRFGSGLKCKVRECHFVFFFLLVCFVAVS